MFIIEVLTQEGYVNVDMNWQEMMVQFAGGLGLFLFSIKYMGDGLQKWAGDRLRDVLDRYTTNPLSGVLVGIIVTILLHSSAATAIITVGLVSAGFLTLRQSIGVIMGANVGTTLTAFLIGFNLGNYAYILVTVGALSIYFVRTPLFQNIGQLLFGLGGMFIGLDLMSNGMAPLANLNSFVEWSMKISEFPLFGVLIGIMSTFIVQSSSVTVGILQGMFDEGMLPIHTALPILFGENIGTTLTVILASIGTTVTARRTAVTHLLFNLIGTVVFLTFVNFFTLYLEWLMNIFNLQPRMVIAFAHGSFNIGNVMLQLPFIGVMVWLVTKVVPGEDSTVQIRASQLDEQFISASPSIAIGQAKEEVVRMGDYSIEGLKKTWAYFETFDRQVGNEALKIEEVINSMDRKITDYLIRVSSQSLSDTDSARHHVLLENIRDIERIGDHFENIVELIDDIVANRVQFSAIAKQELAEMYELVLQNVEASLYVLNTNDYKDIEQIEKREEQIDQLERVLRKKHIHRLNKGLCTAYSGIIFTDIMSNLERIGDHAVNLTESTLQK